MKQLVIELLRVDCDLQAVQIDKVKRDHIAGVMNLGEDDFLVDVMLQFPLLNTPLQSASERIGNGQWLARVDGRVVLLLQVFQQCGGLQSRLAGEQFFDFGPVAIQRVLSRPIGTRWVYNLAR